MKIIFAIFAILSALFSLAHQVEAVNCDYEIPDCYSTMEHDPVCGKNGCNYGNPGKAICGGTTMDYYGHCK